MRRLLIALLAFALFAAACGDDGEGDATDADDTADADTTDADDGDDDTDDTADGDTTDGDTGDTYNTLRVPEDYGTIQAAVDAAVEGDLVLIGPGIYNEAVSVETDNIVIRGLDRNEVILDGEHDEELTNGIIIFADGVAVENLTARNYTSNGVFWTGDYRGGDLRQGYRGSYLTAYNNGLYGIYATGSRYGLFEHSYGSGHPDSAFYIGHCNPCDAVLTDLISENNTLGYSGTNSGGNLYVVNSVFNDNRVGVVPNTLDGGGDAPQHSTTFAGNHVYGNGNADTPLHDDLWELAYGIGIVVGGGNDNLIVRNRVEDNATAGIAVSLFADQNVWLASDNEVRANVVTGNLIDLILLTDYNGEVQRVLGGDADATPEPQVGADGNCYEGNTFETSAPEDIETVAACGGGTEPLVGVPPVSVASSLSPGTVVDHTEMPEPPDQPNMPDAATAPPRPADVIPEVDDFDLDSITLPEGA